MEGNELNDKKFVVTCDLCQRVKAVNYKAEGEYQLVESSEPGDLITVDFYGCLPRSVGGVEYIFVVLDAYSKYVKLYAIKKETTRTALRVLFDKYIPEMGKPRRLLTDNGTQFKSPVWGQALRKGGIRPVHCAIRHPQSNPTERVMRELGRLFRTLFSDAHTRWAKHLPEIECFMNITTHSSTGFSPHELHFGVKPYDQIRELVPFPSLTEYTHDAKIRLAKEKLLDNFERRKRSQKNPSAIDFVIGDLVLLRVPKQSDKCNKVTEKFFHLFFGPYKIAKRYGQNVFELRHRDDSERIIGTYNRCSLRKYHSR